MDRKLILLNFCDACADGNLSLAKKLTVDYNLKIEDVQNHNNGAALRLACTNGNIIIARWLINVFCFTNDYVRLISYPLLNELKFYDQKEIVQWLLDDYYTVETVLLLSKTPILIRVRESG